MSTADSKNRPDAEATRGTDATDRAGTSDQAIGRPDNWREGRYQQPGKPVDQSVNKPSETTAEPHDTVGTQTPPATGRDNAATREPPKGQTPVTRKDYE
jgi:hypothetical protein